MGVVIRVALLALPIVEIAVLVMVGERIGVAATVLLVVLAALAGGWLIRNRSIRDPRLTELGREQARTTAEILAGQPLRRVVASPYIRSLETAEIIAERLGLPISVEPLVGERAAFVCDFGSPIADLAARW